MALKTTAIASVRTIWRILTILGIAIIGSQVWAAVGRYTPDAPPNNLPKKAAGDHSEHAATKRDTVPGCTIRKVMTGRSTLSTMQAKLSHLPLSFEPNWGQAPGLARFVSR